MQIIEYPVSLVMKAWHVFLTWLGMDAVSSWPLTIVLLVVTVRLILLPFAYRALYSSRMLINLRPALHALEVEYKGVKDRDRIREKMAKRKQLQQDGGYRMRDGCLPALIQIPFFLGLYRILLTVSRPTDLENGTHQSIGALNGTDVGQFLQAEVFGVPLPAYSVMTDERFDFLGTSSSEVFHIALPLCLIASVLTTSNTAYSLKRNWMTLDEDSAVARGLFKFMVLLLPVMLIFPLAFGLAGPAPVAIMCYWVMNNLWTVAQSITLQLIMDRKAPYTEEFLAHRREVGARRKQLRLAKKSKDLPAAAPAEDAVPSEPDTEPDEEPDTEPDTEPEADEGPGGRHRID
ncbi:membrane protein insertase YidC [Corynebacterium variabile]|uniref:membrane protein insertase YidC n=1 Tax=Corynebacterium variabile TaxID=1727 RepID=UPI001D79A4CF|nr:membrane protein insertase YidC [Corynebacterium variabile]HJG46079.1 membrane protein insertase YidC [Corynebacterium variabile]